MSQQAYALLDILSAEKLIVGRSLPKFKAERFRARWL